MKHQHESIRVLVRSIRLNPLAENIYGDGPDSKFFDSIKQCGLLQELVVVKRGRGYNLISGRKRLQVLRKLGEKSVAVSVIDLRRERRRTRPSSRQTAFDERFPLSSFERPRFYGPRTRNGHGYDSSRESTQRCRSAPTMHWPQQLALALAGSWNACWS